MATFVHIPKSQVHDMQASKSLEALGSGITQNSKCYVVLPEDRICLETLTAQPEHSFFCQKEALNPI